MVKVTKEQSDLITKVLRRYDNDRTRATLGYVPNKLVPHNLFITCMIEGYEVTKSKEEKIKDLYDSYNRQGPARSIIRQMCDILELKVDGINS